jgi:hypothetical protein
MVDIDTSGIDPELLNDPTFQRVLADAFEIQNRFSAEPVYAKTGRGYLKSAGVEELKVVKEQLRVREAPEEDESEN